jgi:hypothetical protein
MSPITRLDDWLRWSRWCADVGRPSGGIPSPVFLALMRNYLELEEDDIL